MTHYVLAHDIARQRAVEAVRGAPAGWVVRISPPSRTLEQNALYWAAIGAVAEQVRPQGRGHDPDVWHAYFKALFLPGRVLELPTGEVMEAAPTTTGLSRAQFSDYVDEVLAWATTRGVIIDSSVTAAGSSMTTPDSAPSPTAA